MSYSLRIYFKTVFITIFILLLATFLFFSFVSTDNAVKSAQGKPVGSYVQIQSGSNIIKIRIFGKDYELSYEKKHKPEEYKPLTLENVARELQEVKEKIEEIKRFLSMKL